MKNIKYLIFISLFFILVGIAVVSTTLGIEMSSKVAANPDDFKVYFSNVSVSNSKIQYRIPDEHTIIFENTLERLNDVDVITYEVTNASSNYDAELSMTCTSGDQYFSITNSFDTSTNLEAKGSRTGTLTLKKIKSSIQETQKNYQSTCTITATAVERTSIDSDVPNAPTTRVYSIGDEIIIGTEKFNVIGSNDETVTLLAQYNLDSNYKQTEQQMYDYFCSGDCNGDGWDGSVSLEIDLETHSSVLDIQIANYIDYLNDTIDDTSMTGSLVGIGELSSLGCVFEEDSLYFDCSMSPYSEWLINDQHWWTRIAEGEWFTFWAKAVGRDGYYFGRAFSPGQGYWSETTSGIRPTITVSKSALSNYLN